LIPALFETAGDDIRAWARLAADLAFTDFVSSEDGFATELTDGRPWRNADACGIYTWVTRSGDAYVGQAVKVRNRLRQHWKVHRTLAYAAFKPVVRERLDEDERRLIAAVEAHRPVLNVKHALSSAAVVPLDAVVPPDQVERFLAGSAETTPFEGWPLWQLLETKHAEKFRRLAQTGAYEELLHVLAIYVSRCILQPSMTEVAFWSVTALGGRHGFRLNVGQQECLTLWSDENRWVVRVLAPLRLGRDWYGPLYGTSSYCTETSLATFDKWLSPRRVLVCRQLTVWLMRHTTPLNSGSHCPQLVRAALPSGPLTAP